MSTPLATLFSTLDSTKRVLADRLSPAGMLETLTQTAHKLDQVSADTATAMTKSVLVPTFQKEEANKRVVDALLSQLAGSGILSSVGRAKYLEDIPSEAWLESKLASIAGAPTNVWGVPKSMGAITGSFDRSVRLPVSLLRSLKGQQGEQYNVRQDSLDYITKNWKEIKNQPIYVEVDHTGRAWVSEGNHRIMVADKLGEQALPVELRYFTGGNRKTKLLPPETVIKWDEMLSK